MAQAACELVAGDARHHQISDEEVVRLLITSARERTLGVKSDRRLVAGVLQDTMSELKDRVIVVDNQDAGAWWIASGHLVGRSYRCLPCDELIIGTLAGTANRRL
jgi:hypothetical protein